MNYHSIILVLLSLSVAQNQSQNFGPSTRTNFEDVGEPLLLTPLINSNQLEEARNASEIHLDAFLGVKHYAGYLTVNETLNSNLYFWFFPAETDYENSPVVLWLEGGPGAPSMYSLFVEHGPFEVLSDLTLKLRPTTWSKTHSVIYIDSPVGTGFSFTDDGGYATEQTQVGGQLLDALHQFFKIFPELQKNKFYATGESYAGKYVPAVSYAILKSNPSADVPINLKGLAIGNGLCEFKLQSNYADYLYQLGLIDSIGRDEMHVLQDRAIAYIEEDDFEKASDMMHELILNADSLFINLTGIHQHYNYLFEEDNVGVSEEHFGEFLNRSDVRKAIHVGNLPFGEEIPRTVYNHLRTDMTKSVAGWVTELLDHYPIMFYNGQLDIIVPYPLSVNFFQNLNFTGAEEYKTAAREKWYVNGELAGYLKKAGKLTEVLVRNAGHMVPFDQPAILYDLIFYFTHV